MALQLIYTSIPRGLVPGTSGYCVAAASDGIPPELRQQLERLSSYEPLYPVSDRRYPDNPASYSWVIRRRGSGEAGILSRVAIAPSDHTGRSNHIGHHLVLSRGELAPEGPAALLDGVQFAKEWKSEPAVLDSIQLPRPKRAASMATWTSTFKDAGCAAELLADALGSSVQPCYVVFPDGADVLALMRELLACLPEEKRWTITFSTYEQSYPASVECRWRWVPESLRRSRLGGTGLRVIDPTKSYGATGATADLARHGKLRAARSRRMMISSESRALRVQDPVGEPLENRSRLVSRTVVRGGGVVVAALLVVLATLLVWPDKSDSRSSARSDEVTQPVDASERATNRETPVVKSARESVRVPAIPRIREASPAGGEASPTEGIAGTPTARWESVVARSQSGSILRFRGASGAGIGDEALLRAGLLKTFRMDETGRPFLWTSASRIVSVGVTAADLGGYEVSRDGVTQALADSVHSENRSRLTLAQGDLALEFDGPPERMTRFFANTKSGETVVFVLERSLSEGVRVSLSREDHPGQLEVVPCEQGTDVADAVRVEATETEAHLTWNPVDQRFREELVRLERFEGREPLKFRRQLLGLRREFELRVAQVKDLSAKGAWLQVRPAFGVEPYRILRIALEFDPAGDSRSFRELIASAETRSRNGLADRLASASHIQLWDAVNAHLGRDISDWQDIESGKDLAVDIITRPLFGSKEPGRVVTGHDMGSKEILSVAVSDVNPEKIGWLQRSRQRKESFAQASSTTSIGQVLSMTDEGNGITLEREPLQMWRFFVFTEDTDVAAGGGRDMRKPGLSLCVPAIELHEAEPVVMTCLPDVVPDRIQIRCVTTDFDGATAGEIVHVPLTMNERSVGVATMGDGVELTFIDPEFKSVIRRGMTSIDVLFDREIKAVSEAKKEYEAARKKYADSAADVKKGSKAQEEHEQPPLPRSKERQATDSAKVKLDDARSKLTQRVAEVRALLQGREKRTVYLQLKQESHWSTIVVLHLHYSDQIQSAVENSCLMALSIEK